MDTFNAVGLAEGFIEGTCEEQREAWQHLVDTGLVWQLQGWFGRTAQALIDAGEIEPASEPAVQIEAANTSAIEHLVTDKLTPESLTDFLIEEDAADDGAPGWQSRYAAHAAERFGVNPTIFEQHLRMAAKAHPDYQESLGGTRRDDWAEWYAGFIYCPHETPAPTLTPAGGYSEIYTEEECG